MPACGKTTVGKELSSKLGYDFIDMDALIENSEGVKISEIFLKKGEKYFRNLETSILSSLSSDKPYILSTGGGVVENKSNISILFTKGEVFYLEIKPSKIFKRIKDDKTRPLLQNPNPKETLTKIYRRRKKKYECANFKIQADVEPNLVADRIIEIYEKTECENTKQVL